MSNLRHGRARGSRWAGCKNSRGRPRPDRSSECAETPGREGPNTRPPQPESRIAETTMGRHIGSGSAGSAPRGIELFLEGTEVAIHARMSRRYRREGCSGMHHSAAARRANYRSGFADQQKVKRYYGRLRAEFRSTSSWPAAARVTPARRPDVAPGAPAGQCRHPSGFATTARRPCNDHPRALTVTAASSTSPLPCRPADGRSRSSPASTPASCRRDLAPS